MPTVTEYVNRIGQNIVKIPGLYGSRHASQGYQIPEAKSTRWPCLAASSYVNSG